MTFSLSVLFFAILTSCFSMAAPKKTDFHSFNDSDPKLFSFMIGTWKLNDLKCVSGASADWGTVPFTYVWSFKSDLTVHSELHRADNIWTTMDGSFSIDHSILSTHEMQDCSNTATGSECSPGSDERALISIQNDDLKLLWNMGDLGGPCPAEDVLVMKFQRLN